MTYTQANILDIIAEGERLRDAGIAQAIDHAEQVTPQWAQKAFNLLVDYLREYPSGHKFQAEDFRLWCELSNRITSPPSKRAYGGVVVRAANQHLIKKVGHATVKNVTAHRCFSTLWEKL